MTYLTERLPKDILIALACGIVGAMLGGLLTCFGLTLEFTREYPHDGQNGLGGFVFGIFSMFFFGPASALGTLLWRYSRYRKECRDEEEKAFEAELLAARNMD